MKRLLLPALIVFAFSSAALASPGDRIWTKRFDGPGDSSEDYVYALAVSPDGTRVFVTGSSGTSFSDWDYVTIAYDASTGERVWANRYDGPAGVDYPSAMAVSPDGTEVFVTGSSEGSDVYLDYDYATIA